MKRMLAMILLLSILAMGCGENNDSTSDDQTYLEILILLTPEMKQAEITRIILTVSAADMGTIDYEMEIYDNKATITVNVPHGENRLFKVKAYSGDSVELEGDTLIPLLKPGEALLLEINLVEAMDKPDSGEPTDDFPILAETLGITEIKIEQSSIGIGEITTLEASVDYSGDEALLMYNWTTDAGEISGSDGTVVYKAPKTPGTYYIKVIVTDGIISSEKTVTISVVQQFVESLILDINKHWPADKLVAKLCYDVSIEKLIGGKVLLHYDITQDGDDFDVFFSIQINQMAVLKEMAIGGEIPSTAKRTVDSVDISDFITEAGLYLIEFSIKPGNRAENGWLMNEAKITGVQGSSDPRQ